MRIAAAAALAVLAFAAPAQAKPHAVIAFLPSGAGETRPLLEELAARGMAVGMTSPTVGGFKPRQMGLDMSQGTRIPTRLYSGPIGALSVRRGFLSGWDLALRRADRAPGDIKPGLLAQTIERAGGRVGYSLRSRGFSIAPIVAADEDGGVRPAHPGDALDVLQLAPGRAGLHQLDLLLARRADLVYVVRAPDGGKLRLLASGMRAPGVRGQLRSATTRRTGLIAAIDVAPSVLRFLRIAVPNDMQGQVIEARGASDPKAVERMADRLAVVASRRGTALVWLAGAFLLLLVTTRRFALRAALVAGLWVPGLALLTAAMRPGRMAEGAIVGVGSVALGALTTRAVRWPRAAAVPAGIVFLAHAVDLARGSPLIGASLAGPNPAGGARFFGIGNELEIILGVSVLIGTGAALTWMDAQRRAPIGFALAAIVAAGIMGAGRLGADVGAVITLGAGGAAAVIASLRTPPTRRVIALGVAAPVVAIGVLILLDVVTGGGAHLTRSVLHAHGSGDLADVMRRRFSGSFSTLKHPVGALVFALALGAVVWLAVRGRAALAVLPRAFAAGLIGAWFAVVVGAVANDSGPLILEIGAVGLILAYAHVKTAPANGRAPLV